MDEPKTALVTGGAGFIGSHLVDRLLSLGHKVVVIDNLATVLDRELPVGARLIQADIRDAKQVAEATKGTELIFHIAANANGTISINNPRLDFESNAVGTFNILEAALANGIKRFVYVSSASVYGRPQRFPIDEEHPTKPFVPYGASKLMGELCCLSFFESQGLPVVIGRPFCVYGPGENPRFALVEVSRYLRWHLNKRPIQVVGDMDRKTRDFVHVDDVIEGLLLIAAKADAGEVFNLGSGQEVSMRQLTEVIGAVTGRTAIINNIANITDDTYRLVADISKIKSLGYLPRVALAEGIGKLAVELGENPGLPSGATIFKRGQKAEE